MDLPGSRQIKRHRHIVFLCLCLDRLRDRAHISVIRLRMIAVGIFDSKAAAQIHTLHRNACDILDLLAEAHHHLGRQDKRIDIENLRADMAVDFFQIQVLRGDGRFRRFQSLSGLQGKANLESICPVRIKLWVWASIPGLIRMET